MHSYAGTARLEPVERAPDDKSPQIMDLHCALCRGPWRILEDVLELRELVCLRFTLNLRCIRCLTRLQEGVPKQGGEPKKKVRRLVTHFFLVLANTMFTE